MKPYDFCRQKTLYQIGSVKKAFTTLGMLILENDGQISLEDLKFTKTALHFAK
jgi:CubicO group peptidase (beta-lactamase class C family)